MVRTKYNKSEFAVNRQRILRGTKMKAFKMSTVLYIMKTFTATVIVALCLLQAACGQVEQESPAKPVVVATTTMIEDLAWR